MIKKVFVFSFIFTILIGYTSVYAMEISLPQVGGIADLGYGLSLGANFDFSDSKYVVQNWDNLTLQQRQEAIHAAAWDFMEDYCISRGIPYARENEPLPLDTKAFFKSAYFDSNIKSIYSNYLIAEDQGINSDSTLRMPISLQGIADWTLYNYNAWEKYKADFAIDSDPDSPVISLPSDYEFLNDTKEALVLGRLLTDISTMGRQNVGVYDLNYYGKTSSFYSAGSNFTHNLESSSSGIDRFFVSDQIITINFDSTTNTATYSGTNWISQPFYGNNSITGNGFGSLFNANYQGVSYLYCRSNPSIGDSASTQPPQTSFAGLSTFANYVYNKFTNVNVYVDGDCWLYTGIDSASANPVIPDFPDVINPDGDLPIDLVDLPNTTDYEGTFDITSLFDAIKEAIAGASDSESTTSGVLTGEAVKDTYRDKTGELVGEATIPLADIIDDSFPIQDTDNYPNLPMYDKPIKDAFKGTTILSELIDATQKSLPEDLVAALWGIVFILFIIGLIKVLHK